MRLIEVADALALGRGEPGERLVEQQHARRVASASAHVEQALAAIGERAGLGALDAGERRDSGSARAVSRSTSSMRARVASRRSKRCGWRACTASRTFSSTDSAGNRLVIWNERPMPAAVIASGAEAGDRAAVEQ